MRIFAAFGIALLLAGCAAGGGRPNDRERYNRVMGKPVANPSAIVQAELAFARLAQEKGQWTAFRETAADDAIMFTPGLVNAQQWLKDQTDPAQAVTWQPHHIYMSCDGGMAVSTGAWQDAKGGAGHFTTIWQQQDFGQRRPDKKIDWKWVFDDGEPLDRPLAEPDYVETDIASCKTKTQADGLPTGLTEKGMTGTSRDRSLVWHAAFTEDGSRIVFVDLAQEDGSFKRVHEYRVAAPAK
ncbi:hypothetical protein [Parasphingorhabdus sp.]|uniref:hypothetical protein n=1 Tax=Parasphingorhabdus sp. TaxID=2709688 RepID=UPI003002E33A